MMIPSKRIVAGLRAEYPDGCRIVLDKMDDVQAPPVGTQGTVHGVDDTGSILVHWDTGSRLNVVYDEDQCHKVSTDAEIKVSLERYGEREKLTVCPRCGAAPTPANQLQAVSRRVNIMICDQCGAEEALEEYAGNTRPLTEWFLVSKFMGNTVNEGK